MLIAKRARFEQDGIFPAGVIDMQAKKLMTFHDKGLSDKLLENTEAFTELVEKYLHILRNLFFVDFCGLYLE